MKKLFLLMLALPLLTNCMSIKPKYIGKVASSPEQRVTFIGEGNNHTNKYTRTIVTVVPFPLDKKHRYAPYAISTYPIPEKVYISCSNFRDFRGPVSVGYVEYRRSYIKSYDFKPGKFYQFECTKADNLLKGEYGVNMLELDSMPVVKDTW